MEPPGAGAQQRGLRDVAAAKLPTPETPHRDHKPKEAGFGRTHVALGRGNQENSVCLGDCNHSFPGKEYTYCVPRLLTGKASCSV